MKKMIQGIQYFIFFMALIFIDQFSKSWVVSNIQLSSHIDIIPNFLYLTFVKNTGAGFSLFENYGILFFSVLTISACTIIVYTFFQTEKKLAKWILVMILAGAIGNFIDRLMLGYVRDFIGVYIFDWAFPIFNGADIFITGGFMALIGLTIIEEMSEKQAWKNKQL